MKEKYQMYKDVVFVVPFLQTKHENRFGMMALMIYGINNQGKIQVFAFGFVSSKEEDEEDFHFLFHHFAQFMERAPKIILLSR